MNSVTLQNEGMSFVGRSRCRGVSSADVRGNWGDSVHVEFVALPSSAGGDSGAEIVVEPIDAFRDSRRSSLQIGTSLPSRVDHV